jgi:hypothetical protein
MHKYHSELKMTEKILKRNWQTYTNVNMLNINSAAAVSHSLKNTTSTLKMISYKEYMQKEQQMSQEI